MFCSVSRRVDTASACDLHSSRACAHRNDADMTLQEPVVGFTPSFTNTIYQIPLCFDVYPHTIRDQHPLSSRHPKIGICKVTTHGDIHQFWFETSTLKHARDPICSWAYRLSSVMSNTIRPHLNKQVSLTRSSSNEVTRFYQSLLLFFSGHQSEPLHHCLTINTTSQTQLIAKVST